MRRNLSREVTKQNTAPTPDLPSTESPTDIDPVEKQQGSLARTALIVTFVLGVLGHAATIGAAFIGQEGKAEPTVVSCPAELDKALEVRRDNPTVDITYTGELEAQCQLNSAVRQVPIPIPDPVSAPAPS